MTASMTAMATIDRTDRQDLALSTLLEELDRRGYDFVTPTPATHERLMRRRAIARPGDLRDILGWSRTFQRADAPAFLLDALEAAGQLAPVSGGLKSSVRVSRLAGRLFLHSAYPTDAEDAVFLGPDSYRFADVVRRELSPTQRGRIVDVGGGAGVGAILARDWAPAATVEMTDNNPLALRLARINARHAGAAVHILETDGMDAVEPGVDLVIANPPYMGASAQTYRDGGGSLGGGLSLAWADAALKRLNPGGRMVLYTGSAIRTGGCDMLGAALRDLARRHGADLTYSEIDPDVFGEELGRDLYREVERIAVVVAVLTAR